MLDALLSEARRELLALFLMRPGERLHLREAARRVRKAVGTVQRELASLEAAGILTKTVSGNRTYYEANTACPIYPELRGILAKTVGLCDVLREVLAPLADGIRAAFVYGSMASGEAQAGSDVDLMVVGEVDEMALHSAVSRAEERLGREVNYTLLEPAEFRRRRSEEGGFVARVLAGPRLDVAGTPDGLR